jgi:hypothetical protein
LEISHRIARKRKQVFVWRAMSFAFKHSSAKKAAGFPACEACVCRFYHYRRLSAFPNIPIVALKVIAML